MFALSEVRNKISFSERKYNLILLRTSLSHYVTCQTFFFHFCGKICSLVTSFIGLGCMGLVNAKNRKLISFLCEHTNNRPCDIQIKQMSLAELLTVQCFDQNISGYIGFIAYDEQTSPPWTSGARLSGSNVALIVYTLRIQNGDVA